MADARSAMKGAMANPMFARETSYCQEWGLLSEGLPNVAFSNADYLANSFKNFHEESTKLDEYVRARAEGGVGDGACVCVVSYASVS